MKKSLFILTLFYFKLYIFSQSPTVYPIIPNDLDHSSDSLQVIKIEIIHQSKIVGSSISLKIDTTVYDTSHSALEFIQHIERDTLIFYPDSAGLKFSNNDTVIIHLDPVRDKSVNFSNSLDYSFIVDLEPPVLSGQVPSDLDTVQDIQQDILLTIIDSISGILFDSIFFSINNKHYDVSDNGLIWNNNELVFKPEFSDSLIEFTDSVIVKVLAIDIINSGLPNRTDTLSWKFYINSTNGPKLIGYSPGLLNTINDAGIAISLKFNKELDLDSFLVEIKGVSYYYNNNIKAYNLENDSTILFYPDSVGLLFNYKDTVSISLKNAKDMAGNKIQNPIDWQFIIDNAPPVIDSVYPENNSGISIDSLEYIKIFTHDELSQIDTTSIKLVIFNNGVELTDTIKIENNALCFAYSIILYQVDTSEFEDGDSIFVWISFSDNVDYGNKNFNDTSWLFLINNQGPVAVPVLPENSSTTSDNLQKIYISIIDSNGIDTNSIVLKIDITNYTIDSNELEFRNDTLVFISSVPYQTGDTVFVELIEAKDKFGSTFQDALKMSFLVDYSKPVIDSIYPLPYLSIHDDELDTIFIYVSDTIGQLDTNSVKLIIQVNSNLKDTFNIYNDSLNYIITDSHLIYIINTTGLNDGDSIKVWVHISDSVAYGDSNSVDTSWHFEINRELGPDVELVLPKDYFITPDTLQKIKISLIDPNEINIDSIILKITNGTNTTIYTINCLTSELIGQIDV